MACFWKTGHKVVLKKQGLRRFKPDGTLRLDAYNCWIDNYLMPNSLRMGNPWNKPNIPYDKQHHMESINTNYPFLRYIRYGSYKKSCGAVCREEEWEKFVEFVESKRLKTFLSLNALKAIAIKTGCKIGLIQTEFLKSFDTGLERFN